MPIDKFHNYSLILVWSPCYMSVIEVEPMASISIHQKHIDLMSLTVCFSRLSTISFEIPDSSTLLYQLYCSDWAFIISNLATFSVSPLSTFFEIITLLFSPSILCEKCPNTKIFLVHIFPYLDWIRKNTHQKTVRIWTLHAVIAFFHRFRSLSSSLSLSLAVQINWLVSIWGQHWHLMG